MTFLQGACPERCLPAHARQHLRLFRDCPIVQLANEAASHMRRMPEIASPSLDAMPAKWKFPCPSLQDFYGMVAELTDRIVAEQNGSPS